MEAETKMLKSMCIKEMVNKNGSHIQHLNIDDVKE